MENKQSFRGKIGIKSGMPLSEKQLAQGFRISGGAEGVLTRLFNILCFDLTGGRGITPIQWNKYMSGYIQWMIKHNIKIDRSSIRGNMNKALREPGMTWNVLFKGFIFLEFEACTASVSGLTFDGREFNSYSSASFEEHSQFEHMFPKEVAVGYAVQRKDTKKPRPPRVFSDEPGGVLAKLFTMICLSLTDGKGYTTEEWNEMLTVYIDRTESHLTDEKKMNVRSNLNKEFRCAKMTWKVFCKSLQFLPVASFNIHFTAYRTDKTISECETSVTFAPRT